MVAPAYFHGTSRSTACRSEAGSPINTSRSMRMRSGADYRQALRDGRRVWVMGEGLVDDVTTHPATRAMVDEYVAWYDLHFEAAWQDIALRPLDAHTEHMPWAYVVPKSADDLSGMGRFFSATTFL